MDTMMLLTVQMLLVILLAIWVYMMPRYREDSGKPDAASEREAHGTDQGSASTISKRLVLILAMKLGDGMALNLYLTMPPTASMILGNGNIVMPPSPNAASANGPHGVDQGLANKASMKLVLMTVMEIGGLTVMTLCIKKPPTTFVTLGNVNVVMLPLPMPLLHLISAMARPKLRTFDGNACQLRWRLGRGG